LYVRCESGSVFVDLRVGAGLGGCVEDLAVVMGVLVVAEVLLLVEVGIGFFFLAPVLIRELNHGVHDLFRSVSNDNGLGGQ